MYICENKWNKTKTAQPTTNDDNNNDKKRHFSHLESFLLVLVCRSFDCIVFAQATFNSTHTHNMAFEPRPLTVLIPLFYTWMDVYVCVCVRTAEYWQTLVGSAATHFFLHPSKHITADPTENRICPCEWRFDLLKRNECLYIFFFVFILGSFRMDIFRVVNK